MRNTGNYLDANCFAKLAQTFRFDERREEKQLLLLRRLKVGDVIATLLSGVPTTDHAFSDYYQYDTYTPPRTGAVGIYAVNEEKVSSIQLVSFNCGLSG